MGKDGTLKEGEIISRKFELDLSLFPTEILYEFMKSASSIYLIGEFISNM